MNILGKKGNFRDPKLIINLDLIQVTISVEKLNTGMMLLPSEFLEWEQILIKNISSMFFIKEFFLNRKQI